MKMEDLMMTRQAKKPNRWLLGGAALLLLALLAFSSCTNPAAGGGGGGGSDSFITSWTVFDDGTRQIEINVPNPSAGFDFDIDWGDGTTESGVTDTTIHTYASAGTYDISISGSFPYFYRNGADGNAYLVDVKQWGTQQWTGMNSAFHGASNLTGFSASDTPDLSLVTSMFYAFADASSFNGDITAWDVSSVTNMRYAFAGAEAFDQDLGGWIVSSVTNMEMMFEGTHSFDQDIRGWDVSSVTNMNHMFNDATSFSQDLSGWDVDYNDDDRTAAVSHTDFSTGWDGGTEPVWVP